MSLSAEKGPEKAQVRIAFVEDDPSILALQKLVVSKLGYEVLTAADGEEGYELIVRESPDVVVLDVMLPGCDGFSLARRLQENQKTIGIPIAFVTARREGKDFQRGFEAGGKLYLAKPFTNKSLRVAIEALLQQKGVELPGRLDPSLRRRKQ